MKRLLLLAAFVCGVPAICAAAGPFDGMWTAEVVRRPPSNNQILTIAIATSEGKVTGSMTVKGNEPFPIEWGMAGGNVIVFKVKQLPTPGSSISANGAPVMFVYLGRLEGDRIAFTRRPEDLTLGAPVELSALRAK